MIRLLIVDDSVLMRKLLEGVFLKEGGFDVRVARDGAEALELLHSFDPQVVTLDVQMPRMDGLACLSRIMLEAPRPVVMISALTAEGAEARTGMGAGQKGPINKLVARPIRLRPKSRAVKRREADMENSSRTVISDQ